MSPPKGDSRSSGFPSIRYTQGKQEGIRMGPDRHLVCWEISLGRSERLPSPLPAPARQMWGERRRLPALCVRRGPGLVLHPPTLDAARILESFHPEYLRVGMNMFLLFFLQHSPHLCSSPPSPLLLSTILHRSEATSSFCWSVRLMLGRCSWQALLSERLNSRYGTKACWSSSQYSKQQGTCNVTTVEGMNFVWRLSLQLAS